MGIGAESSFWRRALFRAFASVYFRRSCSTGEGRFEAYVSPGSSLRFLDSRQSLVDPVHERFIRDWVDPDAVVWDIGGNLGLFALPSALKAKKGRVFAFEPDAELAANLLRSARLPRNRGLDVSVLCLAVSDSDGVAAFQISRFSRAMNKLEAAGRWHQEQVVAAETRQVVTMRIDSLAQTLPPPNVLKIDVEGAEIQVLEGGEATIAKHRPAILIECPDELRERMGVFFEKHQYVMLDGSAEHLSPLAHPVWDTVAVPKERFAGPIPARDSAAP